eukprot:702908-Rhodomonas_salina.1
MSFSSLVPAHPCFSTTLLPVQYHHLRVLVPLSLKSSTPCPSVSTTLHYTIPQAQYHQTYPSTPPTTASDTTRQALQLRQHASPRQYAAGYGNTGGAASYVPQYWRARRARIGSYGSRSTSTCLCWSFLILASTCTSLPPHYPACPSTRVGEYEATTRRIIRSKHA